MGPAVGLVAQRVLVHGAVSVPDGAGEADEGSLVVGSAAGAALVVAGLVVAGLVVHGDLSIGVLPFLGVARAQRVGARGGFAGWSRAPGPPGAAGSLLLQCVQPVLGGASGWFSSCWRAGSELFWKGASGGGVLVGRGG